MTVHGVSDLDHFADHFVTDRVRPGEQPLGGHTDIEVAAGDGKRPYQGALVIAKPWLGDVNPLDATGLDECQLAHVRPSIEVVTVDESERRVRQTPAGHRRGLVEPAGTAGGAEVGAGVVMVVALLWGWGRV